LLWVATVAGIMNICIMWSLSLSVLYNQYSYVSCDLIEMKQTHSLAFKPTNEILIYFPFSF